MRVDDSKTGERSLYDCFHARVKDRRIYCDKGYRLREKAGRNGALNVERLARGEPLILSVCQECADFESMGDPVLPEERGWLSAGSNRRPDNEETRWQKSLAR
jgi:hypothetical protein